MISRYGEIENFFYESDKFEPNSATNRIQLQRLLALNQLLNIAEYYNKLHSGTSDYIIIYSLTFNQYTVARLNNTNICNIEAGFNNKEDAQAVIDNPNFQEILYTVYKR